MQVLQQENRCKRMVNAIWLRTIDLVSIGKFITLLLKRSGKKKKINPETIPTFFQRDG